MPNKLVIDIETIGHKLKDLDGISKEYFQHWAESKADSEDNIQLELEKIEDGFAINPLTGEVVTIGMLNPETDKGLVLFQVPESEQVGEFEENNIKFEKGTEKEILEKFWRNIQSYDEFITFNGRGFDIPFLMIRSAVHQVKAAKNLLSNRYVNSQVFNAKHIDLLDQLKFYGAWYPRYGNLHMFCKAFNIESPKGKGVDGSHVTKMFEEKRYLDIARYNVDDLFATKKLYQVWDEYLRF